jgi:hypothetical protein
MTRTKMAKEAYKQPISFPKLAKMSTPFLPTAAANEAPIPMGASSYKLACLLTHFAWITYSS